MKTWMKWTSIGVVILATAGVGYWFVHSEGNAGGNQAAASKERPFVPVQTARISHETITEHITAYGRAIAPPTASRVLVLPYEAIVEKVFVSSGESVQLHTPLIQVAPSKKSRLQLQQAEDKLAAAEKNLNEVQQQYKKHLIVKTKLLQAKQTRQAAKRELENLQAQGVGKEKTLTAGHPGVIISVSAKDGALVSAGNPLMTIAEGDHVEVKLGVEPEDITHVHVGDGVELSPVHEPLQAPIAGIVKLVSQQVDPTTQLIDVLVSLSSGAKIKLGAYIKGILNGASATGLVVPRKAILPDGNAYKLFTIRNGHAVKHQVRVGIQTAEKVEVLSDELSQGDEVVLAGNYELQSGMSVKTTGEK